MERAPLTTDNAPSIKEALSQAEQEHWLERPNAPLALRLASFVLDFIFIYLFSHGLHRLVQALNIYSTHWSQFFLGFMDIFIRTCFVFSYLIVSVSHFGGTVGKLLLGLRVVDAESGKTLSLARSTGRICWALSTNLLSLAVALTRQDGKYLHDLFSRTVVKKVRGRK